MDNPGWSVVIDLNDTNLEGMEIPYSLNELSDDNWVGYSIENSIFKAAGSTNNLLKIIGIFKDLVESTSSR